MEKLSTNRTVDWFLLALFGVLMVLAVITADFSKFCMALAFVAATARILVYQWHIEQLYKGVAIKGDDDGDFNNTTRNINL